MFAWVLPEDRLIASLQKDHDSVKALFETFEQALTELKIHAVLGKDIFYPAVRRPAHARPQEGSAEARHPGRLRTRDGRGVRWHSQFAGDHSESEELTRRTQDHPSFIRQTTRDEALRQGERLWLRKTLARATKEDKKFTR